MLLRKIILFNLECNPNKSVMKRSTQNILLDKSLMMTTYKPTLYSHIKETYADSGGENWYAGGQTDVQFNVVDENECKGAM